MRLIGTVIKNARKNCGLTQKQLAKKVSLADTTISSYERGNSEPDFKTIRKILKVCGYDLVFIDKANEKYISVDKFSREI